MFNLKIKCSEPKLHLAQQPAQQHIYACVKLVQD